MAMEFDNCNDVEELSIESDDDTNVIQLPYFRPIRSKEIDAKDPEVQDMITKIGATRRGESLITQVLCRKVMRLEETVNQLIDILEEVGLVRTDKEEESDNEGN